MLQARLLLPYAIVALFSVATGAYVYVVATNIPYADEWAMVPLIERWLDATLTWNDLYAGHDGHRIVLNKLLVLVNVELFDWNILFEIWAGLLGLVTLGVVLALYASKERALDHPLSVITFVAAIAAVFSLRQWENLTAPWSISFFWSAAFVVAGMLALMTPTIARTILAAGLVALGCLCFSAGLPGWPVGLAVIAVEPRLRAGRLLVWVVTASLSIAFYFVGLATVPIESPLKWKVIARGLAMLGFSFSSNIHVISGLSAPTAPDIRVAILLGLVVWCLVFFLLLCIWRTSAWREHAFPLSLIAYGLISLTLAADGRAALGVGQALSSRYTGFSAIVCAGLLLSLPRLRAMTKTSSFLAVALASCVLMSGLYAELAEMTMAPFRREALLNVATVVHDANNRSDEDLATAAKNAGDIRSYVATLRRFHLSGF